MKKTLVIFIALLCCSIEAFAIDESNLLNESYEENSVVSSENFDLSSTDKTLKEKISDIYHLEVEQTNTPNFLLSEILTHRYAENSVMEKTQFWAAYNGDMSLHFIENGDITNHYEFNAINVGYDGYLKDNNADFRLMFNYSPLSSRNVVQNLFADVYISSRKIPHHRITVGNTRPPVGFEGAFSPYTLPFASRAQISRKFGTVRKLGARIAGDYSLVDYDFGVYSSDTYFQEFFPGAEFIGRMNFKPLGKTDGKYGKIILGTSMDVGHRNNNFCVTGAHVQYEYKKFLANFEWAQANGYNGPANSSSDNHAVGFYTTLAYKITPKLQALVRYDELNPNHNISHNNKREYSAGINYFIKGQGLKVFLNYIFCQNDSSKDSHRILLGTQILL